MRSLMAWVLAGAGCAALGAAALAVVLVAGQPLRAGDAGYGAQHALTEAALRLVVNPTARAEYRLRLLDRRVDDLREQAETAHVAAAYRTYDAALHAAVEAVAAAPSREQPALRARLALAAGQLRRLLPALRGLAASDPALYAAASVKAALLLHLLRVESAPGGDDAGASAELPLAEGQPVPFPPNAAPGIHDRFPLTGQHALAQCAACHTEGHYRGTPAACVDCHAPAKPPEHFAGACADCHTTTAWLPASLDHTGLTDCLSCHLEERPAPHYAGQCATCHSTEAWQPAAMDHTGLADCQACHLPQRPAPHYAGQCSLCHDTGGWPGALFNHAVIGAADCAACHAPPANHFTGTCAGCHTDTSSFRNATFTHTFPLNHAGANGTCAACHPGGNTGTYTCANCHAPERMADKHDDVGGFGANCVACHADGRDVDD